MNIFNLVLIGLMFFGNFYFYRNLPDKVPMHWNIRGEIDNYMSKTQAVWLFPVMTLVIWILFQILPLFDPKKEKYHLFKKEWQIIQMTLIGFFVYMNFIVYYISINPEVQMMPLFFIGMGILFILLGNYLSKIRQNYFIGFKIPWTLASEDNWNKTHRFASWCFVIAGILILLEAFFLWQPGFLVWSSIMLAGILPIVYSFLLYKKTTKELTHIYLIIIAFVVIFFTLFLSACVWIGLDLKDNCQKAQKKYQQNCVISLEKTVGDEKNSFAIRNSAIWSLGQLGDKKALPTLKKIYTGKIPNRESWNKTLSQYELKKAIRLLEGGTNITTFFRRVFGL